ncbi:acyltransferase family protein [Lysobacter sp. 2RAF19]
MTMPSGRSAASYSPGVDGLRAVAVLGVLLYHAGVPFISGGFVGVDVFFVISGYLITRLLATELQANNRIDLLAFYGRRARRILPALVATLALTAVAAVVLDMPQRLSEFGITLLHAIVSTSNIHFFFHSGYFDADAHTNPLLHTWSLGVEEQFYLVWPWLLPLLGVATNRIRLSILATGIVSLVAAVLVIGRAPDAVFYLTPFRAFEFAIGGLLALWPLHLYKRKADLAFAVGVVLIGVSMVLFTDKTLFPGAAALVPCIGAALCIGTADHARLGIVLRNRPMVYIGLISYALYLAHWPLLVFYKQVRHIDHLGAPEIVGFLVVSILIAVVLNRTIEVPMRKPALWKPTAIRAALAGVATVVVAAGCMWRLEGLPQRPWINNSISTQTIEAGKQARFATRQAQCTIKGWAQCDSLVPGVRNVLVIGDSHGPDALNAMASLYPKDNYALSTLGGCPPHRDIAQLMGRANPTLPACEKLNRQRFDVGYLKQFDYVVVTVLFAWYKPSDLQQYIEFLKQAGVRRVIVIGGYLTMSDDLPELINQYGFDQAKLQPFIRGQTHDDAQLRAATEAAGYLYVSKFDALCHKDGACDLFDDDRVPFTYDKHHLSVRFAQKVAAANADRIRAYLDSTPQVAARR